ncbi:MAG: ABC transporter permease, partial [Acidimicrobiales bacterium]
AVGGEMHVNTFEDGREDAPRIAMIDGDQFVVADGAAGPMTSTTPFPTSVAAELAESPGVEAVTPLFLVPNAVLIEGQPVGVMVIATPEGAAWPRIIEGRAIAGGDEVVVDRELTELTLGDEFVLGGATKTVVGVTEHATWDIATAGLFVDAQEGLALFAGGQDVATALVVEGDLARAPDGLEVQSRKAAFDDLLSRAADAKRSIDSFRVTLWALAVVIVGAVLYLSALERVSDFAIFKATGASNTDLVLGLMVQAAMLGIVAGLFSIGLAHLMKPMYPGLLSLPIDIVWPVIAVAVVIAVLSSFVGIRRAISVDPSQAFG